MGLDAVLLVCIEDHYFDPRVPVYRPSSLCGLSGQADDQLPVLGVEPGHVPRVVHHLLRQGQCDLIGLPESPTWSYIQGT